MATISYVKTDVENGSRATVISWSTLTTINSDGQWFEATAAFFVDKTVQVLGTMSGATITWEGTLIASPSATDGSTLHAPDGENLAFTATGIEAVLENAVAIRPVLTGGDGSTDVDVYLLCASSARK